MQEQVKEYYGETLKSTADLQTNACCTTEAPPEYIRKVLISIHDEVLSRYYGCGLVVPEQLEGARILDLGCGAGRDCYALAALAGEQGEVIGVDMTSQQLAVARRHLDYHANTFGYSKSNVHFLEGELEKLGSLGLAENSFDIIVSNCVINLCTDKEEVLRQAWSLLKPGGEMYFSDVYANRRLPDYLRNDPVLYGECLINSAKRAGFADPRLVIDSPITIENPALGARLAELSGETAFYSATYRLFKLDTLEPACEDYGQAVIYKGTVAHHPAQFVLDKHHVIPAGKVFPVCGNTYRMLNESRFQEHFDFIGDWSRHFGIFTGCGVNIPFEESVFSTTSGACC
jgi:arsenite methyltransferase